jgi:hypothetical protein
MLAALPAASQAEVGGFGYVPCGEDSYTPGMREWTNYGQQMIGLYAHCGDNFHQYFQVPVKKAWGPNVRSLPLGPGKITSVEMKVTGADQSAQGADFALAVCTAPDFPAACGTPVRGNTSPPELPRFVKLTAANGGIPDGADQLVLYSTCTLDEPGTCAASTQTVQFSNLYVSSEDSTPPQFDDFEPPLDDAWLKNAPSAIISTSDPESGILKMHYLANDGEQIHDICQFSQFVWGCPGFYADETIDGLAYSQGRNIVTVLAESGAGLTSQRKFKFRFDDKKPSAPAGLHATGARGGWIVGSQLNLGWTNYPEDGPTAKQSGVSSAIVELTPATDHGSFPSHLVFTGSAISAAQVALPWEDHWNVQVAVVDEAGNQGDFSTLQIDNEIDTPSAPQLDPASPVNIANSSAGLTLHWTPGYVGRSGHCGTRGWIGQGTIPDLKTDASRQVATGENTDWTISSSGLLNLLDGPNTVAIAGVDCAGEVSDIDTETVMVDLRRPTAGVAPASGWLADGASLALDATDPGAPASGSGVDHVWYQIGAAGIVNVPGSSAAIPVPSGKRAIKFGSVDSAGNPSLPAEVTVGHDADAPLASIEPSGAPGEFTATVSDSVSGVVDAWTELSPAGSSSWTRVGDRFVASPGQTAPVLLHLRVPDDGSLPPGQYNLRVVARDEAGNIQTAVARTISLPLRAATKLSAGIAAVGHAGAAQGAVTLDLGKRAVLRGYLRDGSGAGIAGAALRIVAQRDGGGKRLLATATTAAGGGYSVELGTDVSRTLLVSFDGDATRGSSAASARENVRTAVSLRLSAKHVHAGRPLYATGRVTLLAASVPANGVPLEIQYCARTRCTTLSIPKYTDSDGGFRVAIPTTYSAPTKLILRARVRSAPGWPFAEGFSDRRSVVIR